MPGYTYVAVDEKGKNVAEWTRKTVMRFHSS